METLIAATDYFMQIRKVGTTFEWLLRDLVTGAVVPESVKHEILGAYERLMRDHLLRIPGISSTKTSFLLTPVKNETALPLGKEAG